MNFETKLFSPYIFAYEIVYNTVMSTSQRIREHFEQVAKAVLNLNEIEIEKAVMVLERARQDDAFVWIVGNGGSAATASHFANDLEKICNIRAISVPDLTPTVLAHGNDEGWEVMFAKIVGHFARSKDVVVAISCGGQSENVLEVAKKHLLNYLIIMTGDIEASTNQLVSVGARAVIGVPAEDIKVQEDIHLVVCHAIVEALQQSAHWVGE